MMGVSAYPQAQGNAVSEGDPHGLTLQASVTMGNHFLGIGVCLGVPVFFLFISFHGTCSNGLVLGALGDR